MIDCQAYMAGTQTAPPATTPPSCGTGNLADYTSDTQSIGHQLKAIIAKQLAESHTREQVLMVSTAHINRIIGARF